ncbi:28 kDa outer membrane protein [Bacteroidales bacterium Barb6]|nr:28 kDa outer membrane protein [Bacteroidales bacterium Barb6]
MTDNRLTVVSLLLSFSLLCGCSSGNKAAEQPDEKTVIVGLAYSATYPELFKHAVKNAFEKKGYKVVIKQVNNGNMLNSSLARKDIDCHLSGHTAWMEFAVERDHLDLSMLITVPSSIYGLHTTTLKARNLAELKQELKRGDVVAIPNDPSNLARGLIFLEDIGLLKLKDDINKYYATDKDIAENPYGIVLKPIDSAQSARVLESVAFSLVFGTEAYNANIISSRIVREIITDERFLVGFIVRTEDLEKTWATDLIEAVRSEEFKNAVEDKRYIFNDFQRPQWYVDLWGIPNDFVN